MLVVSKLSVHPSSAFIYPEYIKEKNVHYESLAAKFKGVDRYHRNRISKHARKRLNRAIDYLCFTAPTSEAVNPKTGELFRFKTTFITLTLSATQMHSDAVIKADMLNHFFVVARQKWGLRNYVWKAERQANCNIHFHIVADIFIPYYALRDAWNRIQSKLGYIDRFKEIHGHSKPNSTDIHSTKKVKNLAAYIGKYMSKDYRKGSHKVSRSRLGMQSKSLIRVPSVSSGVLRFLREQANVGRIWGCSYELSNIEGGREYVNKGLNEELMELARARNVRYKRTDYCGSFYFNQSAIDRQRFPILFSILDSYCQSKFNLKEKPS